jgi:predicted  nucleic acid-binding Zn-ribbon protein
MLTLKKRTATLRTLLASGASEHKVLRAAEKVREAKIQVLRATIGQVPSVLRMNAHSRRLAKLNSQIETLRKTTPECLLAEFKMARRKTDADS